MAAPKILVIDPNEDSARQLMRVIAGLGYQAITVGEVSEALTAILGSCPDLVVLGDSSTPETLTIAETLCRKFKLPLLLIANSIDRVLINRYKTVAPEGLLPRLVNDPAIELAVELALQRARNEQEQETAMAVLAESEARFRGIFTTAVDGAVLSDQSGVILLANPRAEALLGYGPGEMVGQRIEVLVPERLRETHRHLRADYAPSP